MDDLISEQNEFRKSASSAMVFRALRRLNFRLSIDVGKKDLTYPVSTLLIQRQVNVYTPFSTFCDCIVRGKKHF